jgi:hypothetical protein
VGVVEVEEVVLSSSFEQAEITKITTMLMIILITIFFIIPHFDGEFRSTIYIPELGEIYKNGDFTWRVSDCEELVGVTHRVIWRKIV